MSDEGMQSWRARKANLRAKRDTREAREALKRTVRKRSKSLTNERSRLIAEAQEAARNPHNLHDGYAP